MWITFSPVAIHFFLFTWVAEYSFLCERLFLSTGRDRSIVPNTVSLIFRFPFMSHICPKLFPASQNTDLHGYAWENVLLLAQYCFIRMLAKSCSSPSYWLTLTDLFSGTYSCVEMFCLLLAPRFFFFFFFVMKLYPFASLIFNLMYLQKKENDMYDQFFFLINVTVWKINAKLGRERMYRFWLFRSNITMV